MDFLGGQQREAGLQIEAKLRPEDAERAGTGPVVLVGAVLKDMLHQVEVLAHGPGLPGVGMTSRHSKAGRLVTHRADDSACGAYRVAAGCLRGA
jgi:hypothetical protein